jgi:uncharacterized protein (UPF0335 family)
VNAPAAAGHNSGSTHERLKSFVERIEKLNEEADALKEDTKEVFGEAKDAGFDVKIMRKVIALRKKTKEQRDEEEALTDTYLQALGMI